MTQIDRRVNPSFQVIAQEREERHTRVVKELSEEEEPMERSLKKTMATSPVGCETARPRKQGGSGYSFGRKEGGKRGNMSCGRGEKGVGKGVDISAVGQKNRNVEGNFECGAGAHHSL